jgi:MraZ protein
MVEQTQAEVRAPKRFVGTYRHRIDEKGRVAIPAQLRRLLPDGSIVAPGPDGRLMIWPPEEWERQLELFRRTAETPAQERMFMRDLTGNSYPFEVDAQGRLLLSAPHRAFARLVDVIVFVGLDTAVEIAAEEIWGSDQRDLTPDHFTQIWDLVHQRGTSAPSSPA